MNTIANVCPNQYFQLYSIRIHQALAKGVPDHQQCALDIDALIFDHLLITFAIEADSNSMFDQSCGTKCNGNQLEQHFELELCFSFEKGAREAASLGASGHVDMVVCSCLVTPF